MFFGVLDTDVCLEVLMFLLMNRQVHLQTEGFQNNDMKSCFILCPLNSFYFHCLF